MSNKGNLMVSVSVEDYDGCEAEILINCSLLNVTKGDKHI